MALGEVRETTDQYSGKQLQYLYDVEWQLLRVNMLGSWGNVTTARRNFKELQHYMGRAYDDSQEKVRRLWRIVNYLNAVRMGYSGQKLYGSDVDKLLVEERKLFQLEYDSLKNHVGIELGEWDWKIVESDLRKLLVNDLEGFNRIYENLCMRRGATLKRMNTLKYRDDLVTFLTLMEDVAITRKGN